MTTYDLWVYFQHMSIEEVLSWVALGGFVGCVYGLFREDWVEYAVLATVVILVGLLIVVASATVSAAPLSVPLLCTGKSGEQWIRHGERTGRTLPTAKCANADLSKRRNNTPGGVGEGDRSRRNGAPDGGVGSRKDRERDRLR